MLRMINVNKKENKTILNDVNLEFKFGESTVILGPDIEKKSLLLKLLSGLYRVDSGECTIDGNVLKQVDKSFFYLPYEPGFKEFNTIRDLVQHYLLYYPLMDTDMRRVLNSVNLNMSDKLVNLSFSNLKLTYLILAIFSNASYLFLDNIFLNVDAEVKKYMQIIMKDNKCGKQAYIITGLDIKDYEDLVDNILIVNYEIKNYSLSIFNKFIKYSMSFSDEIYLEDFDKYKLTFMKSLKRSAIIIMRKDFIYNSNVLTDCSPKVFDVIDFDIEDIFHCIGVYL